MIDGDTWVRQREAGQGDISEEQHSLALGQRAPFPKEGTGCLSFGTLLTQEVMGLKTHSGEKCPISSGSSHRWAFPICLVFQVLKIHSGKRIYRLYSNMCLSLKPFQVLKFVRYCNSQTMRTQYTQQPQKSRYHRLKERKSARKTVALILGWMTERISCYTRDFQNLSQETDRISFPGHDPWVQGNEWWLQEDPLAQDFYSPLY